MQQVRHKKRRDTYCRTPGRQVVSVHPRVPPYSRIFTLSAGCSVASRKPIIDSSKRNLYILTCNVSTVSRSLHRHRRHPEPL
jgi:hypothetical protein